MSPADAQFDPLTAEAMAEARQRRAMLGRLAEIGMMIAEEAGRKATSGEEPRHDPAKAFAAAARAVRFSLALQAKVDAEILALRKGEIAPAVLAAEPEAPAPEAIPWGSYSKNSACARRNRVRDAAWEAVNQTYSDVNEAHGALDQIHERLVEGEDFDEFLFRPWRDCVEAICADLGLTPDWSGWSDETGFELKPGPRRMWSGGWTYWPEHADHRRRKRGEPPLERTIPYLRE